MKPTEALTVLPKSELGFESGTNADRSMIETALSRQAQEVQAAMVIAKKYPRDQTSAYLRIINSCKRPGLAAASQYSFPRGGQNITGPSIRMAEVLAQNWGNLDFGIVELEQKNGESIVMSYCWDLETNTRQSKVFTVKHERSKRSGNEILTDPRDIYELVANNGARRLRACILGIIPGDVIDDALAQCDETLRLADKAEGPLIDRVRKLCSAYQSKFQVTTEQLEARIGRKSEAWTEVDYSTLRKIFTGLRDGMSKKEDFFPDVAQAGSVGTSRSAIEDATKTKEAPKEAARERQEAQKEPPAEKAAPVAEEPAPGGAESKETLELDGNPPTAEELRKTISAKLAKLGVTKQDAIKELVAQNMIDGVMPLSDVPHGVLVALVDGWDDFAERLTK